MEKEKVKIEFPILQQRLSITIRQTISALWNMFGTLIILYLLVVIPIVWKFRSILFDKIQTLFGF